jgi:hypothetical protein
MPLRSVRRSNLEFMIENPRNLRHLAVDSGKRFVLPYLPADGV